MAASRRIPAALRALAQRPPLLAAMAAAGMVLAAWLVLTFAVAAVLAAVLPEAWGLGPAMVVLALVFFLPVAAGVLAFLRAGVRVYVVATSGPPPSTPAGLAGGLTGLSLSLAGGRLRRRGPLQWLTDPWGRAAAEGLAHAVPPGHPLAPLLAIAREQQRRPPERGTRWVAYGPVVLAFAAWFVLQSRDPALASVVLAPLLVLPLLGALLAAALRGVLRGAWDRYLADAMAAEAERAAYAPGPGYDVQR